MAIRAIIFDCFGVLVLSGRDSLRNDYPTLLDEIIGLEKQSDYGYISRDQFNVEISELTGLSRTEIEARYWSISRLNNPTLDYVRSFKKSGMYKVGLLSNIGRGWLEDFLTVEARAELFDSEVLSGEVGMIKPQPAIFELAAVRLGVKPEECVMIDDIATNIEAARHVGMYGIIFTGQSQLHRDLEFLLDVHS